MLSRRTFLKTSAVGAAAAGTSLVLPELRFVGEPMRAHAAGMIGLNANENAYGPAPAALAAMLDAVRLSYKYPFDSYGAFFDELARLHGVARNQVEGGCGSTELLSMAARAFTGPGRNLVMASPTFEAIGEFARTHGAQVIPVPLTADFRHDLNAMLAAVTDLTGLVFICNPNNPTGSLTPRAELDAFIAKLPKHVYVLMDEAYHHFVSAPDYTSYLDRPSPNERLFVTRTFSKIYGMAGVRIGYAVGQSATITKLSEQRLDGSINLVAVAGASAAMKDADGLAMAGKRNAADREEFVRQAQRRGIRGIASHTNFVMLETGRPIRPLIQHFRHNGIEIGRPFPPLENHARISLGTPEQMAAFWSAWDRLPKS